MDEVALRERSGLLELTPAEQLVVNQVIGGKSNREIATALSLSEKTIKNHLTSVFRKRGVDNREQLRRQFNSLETNDQAGMLPAGRTA